VRLCWRSGATALGVDIQPLSAFHKMSISQSTTQTHRNDQSSAPKLSPTDTEELERLDASIHRICNAIQEAPYILTIPSDYPYHYSRDPDAWCRNLPFEPDEEHLQYMSFILPEHAESCIVARTEVDEERDRRERERKMNGTPITKETVGTANKGAKKKKMTLDAYKKKQAGAVAQRQTGGPDDSKADVDMLSNGSGSNEKEAMLYTGRHYNAEHGHRRYVCENAQSFCASDLRLIM